MYSFKSYLSVCTPVVLFCMCTLLVSQANAWLNDECTPSYSHWPCENETDYQDGEAASETHMKAKQMLVQVADKLIYEQPKTVKPNSNCDPRILWVRFAGCYIRHSSTNPLGRWRRDESDWHPHAEEMTLKSWCKNLVFTTCWSIFEDGCPHHTSQLRFIPRYIEYTCHVYNYAKLHHFESCSFSHLQSHFIALYNKTATSDSCFSSVSMGPLIIDESIMRTVTDILDQSRSSVHNLIHPQFYSCMSDLIHTWREMPPVFDLLKCAGNIQDIDSYNILMESSLLTFVNFLKKNQHAFNDVLHPMIKEYRNDIKQSVHSKYATDHL